MVLRLHNSCVAQTGMIVETLVQIRIGKLHDDATLKGNLFCMYKKWVFKMMLVKRSFKKIHHKLPHYARCAKPEKCRAILLAQDSFYVFFVESSVTWYVFIRNFEKYNCSFNRIDLGSLALC